MYLFVSHEKPNKFFLYKKKKQLSLDLHMLPIKIEYYEI